MTHFSNRRINLFSTKYLAEGNNLKGNLSDLDDCRWLNSSSDQWKDNVKATGTTYRFAS